MSPSKPFIVTGIVTAVFFLVLSIAPGAIAGTKKSSTVKIS